MPKAKADRTPTARGPKADPTPTRLATLHRLRDLLIQDMETADERIRYQIAPQLSKVLADIDLLDPPTKKVSGFDEIAAARARRISGADVPDAPAERVRQRRGR